ncbi:hypothetical protein [Burkholderia vietnamiensis]|uniref:hypothetical protein n=1 Tax=Burkholderia vietnamiensis TaxID=60552 RepID=UPI000AE0BA7B|nr:hypothetical protein [Burkholderia vietnamiensis]MBR8189073.1 hypothetical protein [Burkholderia vietnamiensis]HDR9174294.1 hypothetical protein [Burkholderia vietnamiensis]
MNSTNIPERTMDDYEAVAARKAQCAEWKPFAYERIEDAIVMTGGVPRPLKSGPRKGEKVWDRKSATRIVVTDAEADDEAARMASAAGAKS